MEHFLGTLVLIFCFSPTADASDESKVTFTDKVKTIRTVDGEYDVIFNEHFGPYSVPYSFPNSKSTDETPDDTLRRAHKNGTPVTVTVDSITETIVGIESNRESNNSNPAKTSKIDLPANMEYLRDLLTKP